MIFLRHILMLSLIGWSLFLPPQIQGQQGDAVGTRSSVSQPSMEWGPYNTKNACEQDGTKYLSDQVIGAR
jgi:hypothetical protein